jgi:hypothetical protein
MYYFIWRNIISITISIIETYNIKIYKLILIKVTWEKPLIPILYDITFNLWFHVDFIRYQERTLTFGWVNRVVFQKSIVLHVYKYHTNTGSSQTSKIMLHWFPMKLWRHDQRIRQPYFFLCVCGSIDNQGHENWWLKDIN